MCSVQRGLSVVVSFVLLRVHRLPCPSWATEPLYAASQHAAGITLCQGRTMYCHGIKQNLTIHSILTGSFLESDCVPSAKYSILDLCDSCQNESPISLPTKSSIHFSSSVATLQNNWTQRPQKHLETHSARPQQLLDRLSLHAAQIHRFLLRPHLQPPRNALAKQRLFQESVSSSRCWCWTRPCCCKAGCKVLACRCERQQRQSPRVCEAVPFAKRYSPVELLLCVLQSRRPLVKRPGQSRFCRPGRLRSDLSPPRHPPGPPELPHPP